MKIVNNSNNALCQTVAELDALLNHDKFKIHRPDCCDPSSSNNLLGYILPSQKSTVQSEVVEGMTDYIT